MARALPSDMPPLAAWLLLVALVLDETVVEVLAVRNRPASDLVSVLEPLAGPDGSVAAMESRLIVKATPAALAQIKHVLGSLDVAPRALWITVRHASSATTSARGGAVAASVPIGGTTVQVSPDGATLTTTTRSQRTRVTGAFADASASDTGTDVQRLQCLEGRPAFIQVGRAEPAFAGAGYVEADTGFWVLPRLAGQTLSLELATSRDAFEASGSIAVRRTSGSLSGRLGEWIPVGGASLARDAQERGLASRATTSTTSDWSVELRVEAADTP